MIRRFWYAATLWRRLRFWFVRETKLVPHTEKPEANDYLDAMPADLLARILINAETLDSIIVGGQALNIWGEHYFERAQNELRAFTPFQSKDIDFFGDREEAVALAKMLDGNLNIPSLEDVVTPSSAMIDFKVGDRHYVVDFLRAVAGLDTRIMKERASTLAIDLPDQDGIYRRTEVQLLNPIDVLLSRIAGITILKRSDQGALRQLAAAPIILKEYILELLDSAGDDPEALYDAQNAVREFITIGVNKFNDIILTEHGIDMLAEVIKLADHVSWEPRFAEFQIRRGHAKAVERRHRRIEESRRKLAGEASGPKIGT
jgi:hypothetical protein